MRKYKARVRQVAALPLHWRDRLRRLRSQRPSFRCTQVAEVPQAALTAAQGAIAQLFRCPMPALGPGVLPFLGCVGGGAALPNLRLVAEATALRFAAAHGTAVEEIDRRIEEVSMRNDSLLDPPHKAWRPTNVLSSVRTVGRRHAEMTRTAGRDLPTQGHIYRHMVESRGPELLRGWLRRRLTTMLERRLEHGEVNLCLARLLIALEAMPPLVSLALFRLIGNAWPTSRRVGGGVGACRFGCMAVGGDDIRHYMACPRLCHYTLCIVAPRRRVALSRLRWAFCPRLAARRR